MQRQHWRLSLGNLDNLDVSAAQMLSTLGITETRMVRMITSLVNAEDKTGLLTDALNVSNSAWEEKHRADYGSGNPIQDHRKQADDGKERGAEP